MRKKLKKARIDLGLTQLKVAKLIGISRRHYCRIENGIDNPGFNVARKIIRILGITIDDI